MVEKVKSGNVSVSEIFIKPNEGDEETSKDLWIFGYGSLIWKPDFPFEYCIVGYIDGFVRRFWQGSIWHRGSSERPGRVLTLVEEKQGRVWGTAFKIAKENADSTLRKLKQREISLGGYQLRLLRFRSGKDPNHTFPVLVYSATPKNSLYLGPLSTEKLAVQIACARGHSGLNVEYLFRLVDFMREKVPHIKDAHLFEVDELVRKELGLSTDVITPWSQLKGSLPNA